MPFACKYCGEEFERKVDLMNHVKSDHKEEREKKKREGGEGEKEEEQVRYKIEEPIYKPIDPRDIMLEVVRGPLANLNERQIAELLDIAEDYDGMLSPDLFEQIVVNFEKVGPKRAAALRERYAIKLNRAQDRLSVAHAERLGLLGESPRVRQKNLETNSDIREEISAGIAEGLKEGRKGLTVDSDVLSAPLGEALSNMAQTTGLINRFLNRVVITAFEEEARHNPLFRKQIVDSAGFFMSKAKGESEGEEGQQQRKGESEEEAGEEEEEEVFDKREGGEKEKNIFRELDEYFD